MKKQWKLKAWLEAKHASRILGSNAPRLFSSLCCQFVPKAEKWPTGRNMCGWLMTRRVTQRLASQVAPAKKMLSKKN